MDLDLDALRAFLAIVDTGGFSRAARVLRRSQSAVSAQVRRLEDAIGAALFDRTGRLPVLTQDGEALIGTARQMVSLNDQVLTRRRGGAVRGMVRLGAMDDYATSVLPGVLSRFAAAYPEVGVELQSGLTAELARKLGVGLDLVLVMHGAGSHRGRILQRDRAIWAAAPGFVVPDDGPMPLAVAPRGCLFRDWAMAALDRAGQPWRIAYLTQSIGAASAAVAAGLAVGVFKAGLLPAGLVPLEGLPSLPDLEIALHRSAGHATPAVTALGDFIECELGAAGGCRMNVPDQLMLEEEDADRPAIEAMLYRLPEPDLRALWSRTRAGATLARGAGDMARLFLLVRGTKTIQRIAGERGILIVATRR